MNWKQLEVKILNTVNAAAKQYSEKWVTAETLGEYIETLNPNWLKRNGSCFNRTGWSGTMRAGTTLAVGCIHCMRFSRWFSMGESSNCK